MLDGVVRGNTGVVTVFVVLHAVAVSALRMCTCVMLFGGLLYCHLPPSPTRAFPRNAKLSSSTSAFYACSSSSLRIGIQVVSWSIESNMLHSPSRICC